MPLTGEGSHWQEGADWTGPRTHLVPVTMQESQFDQLTLVTREV